MPFHVSERDVQVGSGDWALPGTLSYPTHAKRPCPGVVLVHGAGSQDRDLTTGPNKPFLDLAHGLARRGIAVLRYEKRTKFYEARLTPLPADFTIREETVDDALAAIEALASQPNIDTGRVFVIGLSLGGAAAPMIAHLSDRVRGAVLLSAVGRKGPPCILQQLEYVAGLTIDEQVRAPILAQIEVVRALIKALQDGTTLPEGLTMPSAYWRDLQQYDQVEIARRLSKPLLLLHGARDYQATMREDFALWRKGLAGKQDATFRWFRRLNHLLFEGDGPSTPAEYERPSHIPAYVLQVIASWIRRR